MKFLITGGTGFLGSYICKQLLEGGHEVVCYDYAVNQNSIQQVLTPAEMAQVVCVQGDVRDLPNLLHICQAYQVEIIIHLAGMLKDACDKNVPVAVETNLMGTVNMFEAARICGIKRVVWASSSSAIGNPDFIQDEFLPNNVPHAPATVYGKLKDTCEFLGQYYNKTYGLETVGLRYVTIYGMARMRGGSNWINGLLNQPALGQPSEVPCGGHAPNIIYVKDAARITVLAATVESAKLTRSAYFAAGDRRPLSEIRDYVMSILPEANITLVPGYYEVRESYDTSVEEHDLGYKPEYDAFRGAHETINLVRKEAGLPPV